jgi:general nucleoside transport system ATP-binding protein
MSTTPIPPPRPAGGTTPSLRCSGLSKRYAGVHALDGADFTLRPGTVHALLGENGAGKTTLMRVAFGLVQPDSGALERDGQPFHPRSPLDALASGLGMVFQHFSLVPAMTVAENVVLGGRGRYSPSDAAEVVNALGERTGLRIDPWLRIADASLGVQQRCEILKALARDARLLMLDEPTAVLAPTEASELLQWVRRFADAGNSVVLVTHRLRDALQVSDDVTVLRRGRTVLSASARDVSEAALAYAMVGGAEQAPTTAARGGAERQVDVSSAVLEARDVSVVDDAGRVRVRGASFAVHAGEIVGVAGIEGEGQHELLRVIAGRVLPTSGTVRRPDMLGFVPEDRQHDAVLLDGTLTDNYALRGAGRRRGRMPWAEFAARTRVLLAAFDVRAEGADAVMRGLSGGNQQKFVLARELSERPPALVVENPTRGLDIRAADAVRSALRMARNDGTAILCYSSDLDEVLALADRVIVMVDGRIVDVAADRSAIADAMIARRTSASVA